MSRCWISVCWPTGTRNEPKLVRYGDVLMDTHHLRPFAEAVAAVPGARQCSLRMIDGEGRLRYADGARTIWSGRNTLLPNTWLPARKSVAPGQWRLRVLANDTLLASHVFGWRPVGGGEIQEFVASDGEMSATLIQALERRQASQAMSLDDLLADQEEWMG